MCMVYNNIREIIIIRCFAREFEAYMEEVKKIPNVGTMGKREMMQYFKGFVEDYNTATMPHPKYYNYEKWEMEEYHRKQAKDRQREDDGDIPSTFNDEENRRVERKREKEMQELKEFQELRMRVAHDKRLQEDMKRQDQLRLELQQAYKRGDTATVKRLEKVLAPDETGPVVKHPWA